MVKIGQSFPQRSAQHVSESASAKLLRACLPATWLIRELTERDYGIDVLIEIITNGQMAGNMVAGQVKAIKKVTFKNSEEKKFKGLSLSTYKLPARAANSKLSVCLLA